MGATFQLDTSGTVYIPPMMGIAPLRYSWSDLSPFVQGYLAALPWEALNVQRIAHRLPLRRVRFSDLAPETLARIMEDCERLRQRLDADDTALSGACAWRMRQRGDFVGGLFVCPPLTVSLGDDGKAYLRDATS